ncbi:DUF4261 domain-containing protein [Gordonia shandongensis]|uniref:DUF4261 domain-containing protein n=1 Tax=Gordonia shandongensis TaxID=376351 RepID=UPI0003F9BE3C|nr:DUF4261 domain-containing protein [Gordonia shandongensis]
MSSIAVLIHDHPDPQLTADGLVRRLSADFPDSPAPPAATSDPAPGEALILRRDESTVAVLTVPSGLDTDLAEIAARSRLWPADRPVPTGAGGHTIVSATRPGTGDADDSAADEPTAADPTADDRITDVADTAFVSEVSAAAVAALESVRAVYIVDADHLIAPDVFRDLALATLPDPILPAWVAFDVAPRPDGVMTAHTRGMAAFGLMDIEIPASGHDAQQTFERLVSTAVHLLENGPTIADGQPVGDDGVIARHAPSAAVEDKTVLRLDYPGMAAEPDEPRRRWFSRR